MRRLLATLTAGLLALPAAAQVPPIQPPPGMLPDGSNAQMPGIATSLGKWTTQVHQNTQTGECYGTGPNRILCTSDQNHDLIADHSTIQTQDASLISSATVGGTVTANDVVGLDWTVASTLYQIRYTVQSGDTTSTIATNLAACINAGGAAHCTVTAGFLNALLGFHDANGFGYQPRAVSTAAKFAFDQPWAASGNSVVTFLSTGATETLTLGANNTLDNGPYMGTSRLVPGRTPVAADQLGSFYFQGQSAANSGIDTQYGAIVPRVLAQDPTNPQGEIYIATADSGSAKNNNPKVYIGNGVAVATSTGTNPGYPGLGNLAVGGSFFVQTAATFGSLSNSGQGRIAEAVGGANASGVLGAGGFYGAAATTPGVVLGTDSGGNRGLVAGLKYNGSSFNDVGIQTGANAPQFLVKTTGVVLLGAGQPFAWTSTSNDASQTADTGLSRTAAGQLAIGNGTQGDFSGTLKLTTVNAQKELQVSKTGNYSVLSTDSNTFFDNTGAAGEVDFTLPAYAAGLRYCFTVTAAQTLKVIAPASNKIAIGTTNSAAAGNITANTVYSTACLYATTVSNQWAAKSTTGSWTVN